MRFISRRRSSGKAVCITDFSWDDSNSQFEGIRDLLRRTWARLSSLEEVRSISPYSLLKDPTCPASFKMCFRIQRTGDLPHRIAKTEGKPEGEGLPLLR